MCYPLVKDGRREEARSRLDDELWLEKHVETTVLQRKAKGDIRVCRRHQSLVRARAVLRVL